MGKIEKLIARFFTRPKDLTWDELTLVLSYYGFTAVASSGKTSGSRRRFIDANKLVISLHKATSKADCENLCD